MSNVTVTYDPGFSHDAQDAVFYAGTVQPIATVTKGERSFSIVVSGDTRAYIWKDEMDKAGEEEPIGRVWNDGRKWADFGITTDDELGLCEPRIEWVNNSWYSVLAQDTEDEALFEDAVFHSVEDAVTEITEALNKWVEVIVTRVTSYKVTDPTYFDDPLQAVIEDLATELCEDTTNVETYEHTEE